MIATVICISILSLAMRLLPFVFAPFLLGSRLIRRLGRALPGAILILLAAHSLQKHNLISYPFGVPEMVGIGVAVVIHLWRRSLLLSLAASTVSYFLISQVMVI